MCAGVNLNFNCKYQEWNEMKLGVETYVTRDYSDFCLSALFCVSATECLS